MGETSEAIVADLQDRVEAAREKSKAIIAAAEEEARGIRARAEEEAERLLREARTEREREREANETRLRQARRDLLRQLRQGAVQAVLRKSAREALAPATRNPEVIREALVRACAEFTKGDGEVRDLAILLGESLHREAGAALLAAAREVLGEGVEVRLAEGLGGGFRLSRTDEGYVFDFSEEALLEAFAAAYGKEIEAELFAEAGASADEAG